jgi:hypothetical protein
MNSITPEQMFGSFAWLPSKTLAACVHVAARMCLPIWEDFEAAKYGSKRGTELLDAYEQWSKGTLADAELRECGQWLLPMLPENLKKESDPSPGFAGWAIHGVSQVAVEDCDGIMHSIAHTSILYAAGAVCRSGHKMIALDTDALDDCELQFLSQWWEKCHVQNLITEPR